jgi:hypothetical protein
LRDDAEHLLRRGIWKSGANAVMLANYGLAIGMGGATDSAMKHFYAAEFYAKGKHERAVVKFSRALVLYEIGRIQEAEADLRSATADSSRYP